MSKLDSSELDRDPGELEAYLLKRARELQDQLAAAFEPTQREVLAQALDEVTTQLQAFDELRRAEEEGRGGV